MAHKSLGTGIGKGHGGNTVSLPKIHEIDLPPELKLAQHFGQLQQDTKMYKAGKLSIMVSWSDPEGWHMSIAHPERYPTWDEVAYARYALVPDDAEMTMMLPSQANYVNLHNFCFQLHQMPRDWRDLPK